MKGNWKRTGMIAAIVALVGVVGVGTVAYAQVADEDAGWPDFRARIHETIAGVLGISVDEYDTVVETAKDQVLTEAVAEGLLTQEQADLMQERMEQGGPGGPMGSRGSRGKGFMPFGERSELGDLPAFGGRFGGQMGFRGENPVGVAAEVLGLSEEDLLAELQDGKSIADVAEEQGVAPQAIADAFVARVSENLDQAVADGKITQEQADEMLSNIEEHAAEMLENDCGLRMPGSFGGGRPRGGFGKFGGSLEGFGGGNGPAANGNRGAL
jgi:polyhydroxyalkanoate synthesis regulator phasin